MILYHLTLTTCVVLRCCIADDNYSVSKFVPQSDVIQKELQGLARPEEAPELPSLAETTIEEDRGNDAATPVSPTKRLLSSSVGFLVGIYHKLTGGAAERDVC